MPLNPPAEVASQRSRKRGLILEAFQMGRELVKLRSPYDPGHFVFDYFNDVQLKDLAQSLGIDLAVSRQLLREENSSSAAKVSIKVLEVTGGQQSTVTESSVHSGPMPTMTLLEILSRLRAEIRLWSVSQTHVAGANGVASACKAAASEHGWVIVEGIWEVCTKPLALRLLKTSDDAEPLDGRFNLTVGLPGTVEDLTSSGKVRFATGRPIRADVFAQTDYWCEEDHEFIAVAHAVFARMGDPRFAWHGASFGENSNSDF